MSEYLNLPNAENQARMASALEKLADETEGKVTDYTNAPGAKVLAGGDTNYGFYGFVQPSEFGQIEDNPEGDRDFNGENLAIAVGLSSGRLQNSDTAWMKFVDDGEIILVPVKPIRSRVPWNSIYNQGAIYGDDTIGLNPPNGRAGNLLSVDGSKNAFVIEDNEGHWRRSSAVTAKAGDTIVARGFNEDDNNGEFKVETVTDLEIIVDGDLKDDEGSKTASVHNKDDEVTQDREVVIGGNRYKVEVLRGAASDPLDSYSDSDRGLVGKDSQWNHLILPLHENAKDGNWAYKSYAGDVEDLLIHLTDKSLITHRDYGEGSYSWCRETRDTDPARRVIRGYIGASYGGADGSWHASASRGWRPALRLLS